MEELFYLIDKDRSEKDQALVIHLVAGERNGLQINVKKPAKPLTKEILAGLATSFDKDIFSFFMKEEAEYTKKYPGSLEKTPPLLPFIHISYASTYQALKLFSSMGKLYYNDKQLVIDLHSKTEFYYFVETAGQAPVLQGRIKTASQEFDITSCDFIGRGNPHWFIKGISLKLISTDLSWNDLKGAFNQQFRAFHELIEESQQDDTAPRIFPATIPDKPQEPEPLPLLVLNDRLGAFADLWMIYNPDAEPIPFHDPVTNVFRRDGKSLYKREQRLEQAWEKDLLETDFIKKYVDSTHYYCPIDKVAKSIAFLIEIGWHVRDWKGNTIMLQTDAQLHAGADGQRIAVKGKLHYGPFQADLTEVVGAFNRRERFVQISPGNVALLPQSWEQNGFDTLAEEGEIVGDTIQIKRNQASLLSNLFESHPRMATDQMLKRIKDNMDTFGGIESVLPGTHFIGTLRNYQQEGLNWLAFLFDFGFHGLLADDMGLGKTVQVLAFLSRLEISTPLLIVMPTSLIFNWKKEIEKFLPRIPFVVHHGSERSQSRETLDKPQLILTTYTTLRLDFPLLSTIDYECLILDEAQAIKNAHTQTAQLVKKLSSRFRLSITGTPIENNLLELWSHFHFLSPDLFGNEESFRAEIQAGASDPRFFKRIKRKIRPFLLRRCKEDVAKDLPEKIEQIVWVEMNEGQRRLYEEFLSGIRRNLIKKVHADGASKHRLEILEAVMRLRQICCHPLLVNTEGLNASTESSKLDILIEDLRTVIAEGRKVLVYSQFTTMLALIGKRVKELGWKYAYLDGGTKDREKTVTEFQENSEIPLFLISLKAGGIGLNLTAADCVFLYDPWWNNAVENQAIDRAHRIGRRDTVVAKRYIMLESIEEKMMKLKSAKSALAADILDEEGHHVGFNLEDILSLLS